MKTKASIKSNELVDIFQLRLGWNKARVKFFVSFIIALCKVQTVCFNNLAQGFEGKARVESNMRRIQRFFANFVVDTNLIAKLIFSLLPEKPPYRLCLDRTNWKYGAANINILMLALLIRVWLYQYSGRCCPSAETPTPMSEKSWFNASLTCLEKNASKLFWQIVNSSGMIGLGN